jgi:kumamolisin
MTIFQIQKLSLSALHRITMVAVVAAALPIAASAESTVAVASDARLYPGARVAGVTPSGRQITVAFVLPSRDPKGAADFVTHVGTRGDSLFHRYLSPADYAQRFGASASDYAALVAWARANGLTPGETYTALTVLPVTGTVAAFEAALGVTFRDYTKASGDVFYAADRTPRLPADIGRSVASIIGLSSYSHFRPMLRKLPAGARPNESGTGPGGAFSAADLRAAYSIQPQFFAPKTQTLGVFEQGGFERSDVNAYFKQMNIAPVPITVRGVNGYGGAIDDPDVELEAVLDIDMQVAVNPAAKRVVVYEDGTDSFPVALLDSLSAMATDRAATSISISYGQDEALQGNDAMTAENTVLTQLAAQGQAVFVSAGDSGAYGDEAPALNVADPASQPLVTAVGGTTLFTGPGGADIGEETWNDIGLGAGATGGGVSSVWDIPSYQLSFGSPVTIGNGGSATNRNVPDVAAVANPLTGVAVYSKINGGWITIGGTSASAPIWAGEYSLANAASEGLGLGALGFANPTIYSLANFLQYFYPDFHDVFDGTNGDPAVYGTAGFTAGYYYDNTTGEGSFNGNNLVLDMALYPVESGSTPPALPSAPKAKSTANSITLSWKPASGDTAFVVFAYVDTPSLPPVPPLLVAANTATITGLAPSTYYKLQVVPVSAGGLNRRAPFIYVSTKR